MAKGTTTTRIKTARPVTDSELLAALRESMVPIFQHFEEELAKGDGKVLQMEVTAKAGRIKLSYGVGPMDDPTNAGADLPPPATPESKESHPGG